METKFKKGDRVRAVRDDGGIAKGWTGTVYEEDGFVCFVDFDNGERWYVSPSRETLEKIELEHTNTLIQALNEKP